jgi:hypothetical protein
MLNKKYTIEELEKMTDTHSILTTGEVVAKKKEKNTKKAVLKDFYAELGEAMCKGYTKALSHPYIKLDMCPDFDNLLILTFGREVYKFLTSAEGKKIWADLNSKYANKLKHVDPSYSCSLEKK